MKPIHKFNGGVGATLCHKCSVIIKEKLIDDLYCESCKKELINWDKDPSLQEDIIRHAQRVQREIEEVEKLRQELNGFKT